MKLIQYKILPILLLFFTIGVFGQENLLYNKIQEIKSTESILQAMPLTFSKTKRVKNQLTYFKNPEEIVFLNYDKDILNLKTGSFLTLKIPTNNKDLFLELIEVPETFYEYKVSTSKGETYYANRKNKHYRGIIKGDKNSLVAISFFEDDVMGIISSRHGNFNITKIKNTKQYILYNDSNLKASFDFECGTEDDGDFKGYNPSILSKKDKSPYEKSKTKCVKFYFETEYDIYQIKGSVPAVENYVTSLFNQVSTIYQNENIETGISEIKVWNTTDPYTESDTELLLSQFQGQISTFNGDLGQLLTFRNIGGGIAAGFDGICNNNPDLSLSVSGSLWSNIVPFPTYSWNVMVITHEFGHTFGSRHTHACVWNGNNTAIDGCAGFTEGSCGVPSYPIGGGTIMSYCHLSGRPGINFSLGFGTQPGNVIRNRVVNGSCLESCFSCPSTLTINQNVYSGQTDIQEAENSIIATNKIYNNATAEYDAGNVVYLKPGFRAYSGSTFKAYIEGCTSQSQPLTDGSEKNKYILDKSSKTVSKQLKTYPNPTNNILNIESEEDMLSWSLTNQYGTVNLKADFSNANSKNAEIQMQNLPTGFYYLKVLFEDGEVLIKTIIKE